MSQEPEPVVGIDNERLQRAIALAVEARASAYARYSGFAMGASVVGIDGRTTRGVLVENVSLGLSMCAENGGPTHVSLWSVPAGRSRGCRC